MSALLNKRLWRRLGASCVAVAALLSIPLPANAVTFTGSSGSLSAFADFSVVAGNLQITLTNTAGTPALDPASVLTAVFWTDTVATAWGKISALVAAGSSVLFAPAAPVSGSLSPSGPDVGGEWAYGQTPDVALQAGNTDGVSSFDFGPTFRFRTDSNLQGPDSPDGVQYGIVPTSGTTGGNAAVTGDNALISNAVILTLGPVPAGFDLSSISNVVFQYGTALSETHFGGTPIPLPPAILLFGGALAGLGLLGRRRRERTHATS